MVARKSVKKRKAKARPLVRGEPIVHGVLAATLEQLGRVGWQALRIDDVATQAGVNKTTVYRRWPTKGELVRAAFASVTTDRFPHPDTGALRGDLLTVARCLRDMSCDEQMRGIFFQVFAEGPGSELLQIVRGIKDEAAVVRREIMGRAEARGELPPGVDAELLFETMVSSVHRKLFVEQEALADADLEGIVDMLLYGVVAPDAARAGAAARAARRAG